MDLASAGSGPVQLSDCCLDFISHGVAQTHRFGQRLGELAQAGDIYLLIGDLGSGKTCLAQGIASGLGIRQPITSPSFTLINEYARRDHGARLTLYHADLYRLDHADEEAVELGLEEYLCGSGVCVIEWAEKAERFWPREHLTVRLKLISPTKRGLRLEPHGDRYVQLVQEFRQLAFGL